MSRHEQRVGLARQASPLHTQCTRDKLPREDTPRSVLAQAGRRGARPAHAQRAVGAHRPHEGRTHRDAAASINALGGMAGGGRGAHGSGNHRRECSPRQGQRGRWGHED